MSAERYLHTDEAEEAVSALESTSEFLEPASQDTYRWKWVILALHNALQGFMVLTLRGGNGLLALKDDVAAAWLEAYERDGAYPQEKLDTFLGLYKKVKSDRMKSFSQSKPFVPSGTQGRSVKKLNSLRNEFVHFAPKGWSLEVTGLPRICLDCVEVIDYLYSESGNIWLSEAGQNDRVASAISECRRQLSALVSKS